MSEPDYAPFPEAELLRLAAYHEDVAANLQSAFVASLHTDRAKVCRDALAAHIALRERCLVAEMELGQARRIA